MNSEILAHAEDFGEHMGQGWSMMGPGMMGWNSGTWGIFGILWIVTWILIVVALVALIRWLWKRGDKEE